MPGHRAHQPQAWLSMLDKTLERHRSRQRCRKRRGFHAPHPMRQDPLHHHPVHLFYPLPLSTHPPFPPAPTPTENSAKIAPGEFYNSGAMAFAIMSEAFRPQRESPRAETHSKRQQPPPACTSGRTGGPVEAVAGRRLSKAPVAGQSAKGPPAGADSLIRVCSNDTMIQGAALRPQGYPRVSPPTTTASTRTLRRPRQGFPKAFGSAGAWRLGCGREDRCWLGQIRCGVRGCKSVDGAHRET